MQYPVKPGEGHDFVPGEYTIFVRYRDGQSREFKFGASTEDGYRIMFNQFQPRTDNVVYVRSKRGKNGH